MHSNLGLRSLSHYTPLDFQEQVLSLKSKVVVSWWDDTHHSAQIYLYKQPDSCAEKPAGRTVWGRGRGGGRLDGVRD